MITISVLHIFSLTKALYLPLLFINVGLCTRRYCSSTCFTRGWKDHNRLHRLQANTAVLDQQQQQEEEEEEEEEPQPPQQEQQQQQQQQQELKPQEPVPLKSVTKGGRDDDVVDDDDDDDDVDDAKMLIAGLDMVPPVTPDSSRIDGATGPTAGAINGIYEATTELSGDMPVYEMKAKPEKVEKEQVPAKATVRIAGATGSNADKINGIYEATAEMSGDMPVYAKVGYSNMWLEYRASLMSWQVKPTADKCGDFGMAFCVFTAKCLPEECPAGQWQIAVNDKFVPLPAIVANAVTREEVEAYRAQVEEEAARVMKGSNTVTIAGATGTLAGNINGIYKPTEELCGNATVYVKVDDCKMWLEYNASMKQWQAKSTGDKGKDDCWAYCVVPAKCLPEDCPPGMWVVFNGYKWEPQPAVTISVQHDNSDAASAEDIDDDEAKPKAAAMKVASGSIVAQTAGACVASLTASGGVRIVGAMGPNAGAINGMYEATTEISGDMPVYAKVGDGDIWLVYVFKEWNVKTTVQKGTSFSLALCYVPAKCLPEECPVGQWQMYANGKIVPLPAITISVVTPQEADAYLAEVQKEASRLVKGSNNVTIAGATGKYADDINGIYKPTEEFCGNATVYVKVENGDMWLEYRASLKQWQVKITCRKGTDGSTAYCAVPAKCLPEECPKGHWYVYDGIKFGP